MMGYLRKKFNEDKCGKIHRSPIEVIRSWCILLDFTGYGSALYAFSAQLAYCFAVVPLPIHI